MSSPLTGDLALMTAFGTKLCALVIGWLAVFAAASPEGARPMRSDEGAVRAQTGHSARERWEALNPEQRLRMRSRYERIKGLEREELASLKKRASQLRKIERRVLKSLSDADRKRLMQQPPEKRLQLLAELVEAERRNRGQRIEAKLPKEVREWLVQASPKERRARLELFKRQNRERTSAAAVQQVAQALGFGESEVARLKRLPVDQRMNKVLMLQGRLSKEQIEQVGLPKGLSAERWKELDKLPPREYFAELMALRSEARPTDPLGRHRGGRRASKQQRELARELTRLLDSSPKERLDLSELTAQERHLEIDRRRRSRVMRMVNERSLLSGTQVDALKAMSDKDFFRSARRISHAIRQGRSPEVGHEGKRRAGKERRADQEKRAKGRKRGPEGRPSKRTKRRDG